MKRQLLTLLQYWFETRDWIKPQAAKRRHLHTDNFLYPSFLFAAEIVQGKKSQIMDSPPPPQIVRHLLKVP